MRYFLEVSYKGTRFSGFQVQANALTIQGELERAISVILRHNVTLTGASRTDAGVHALQNFFHFDVDTEFKTSYIYNINALLPLDIVVKNIFRVSDDAHCRFLANSRQYRYYITTGKDPFKTETAWYYPYSVDLNLMTEAANTLFNHTDYTAFSKRNTQVFTHNCTITESSWVLDNENLTYNVSSNRFLRGMVRGLVGTMLLVGRKKISVQNFENIIRAKDCTNANFSTPAHGLFLVAVNYPMPVAEVNSY